VSPEPWRRLACTSDCRRERVIVVSGNGSTRPQWREYHEITAHDDHATYLLLALGSLLHQQIVEAARPKPFPVTPGPPIVRTGPLVVDRPARRATVNGAEVRLTEAEHLILETLCAGFGAIVPRETVRQAVWPDAIARNGSGKRVKGDSFKVLRTLLNRLREKLGPAGALIDTFSGRGFLLRDEPISEGTGGGP
jgi:DNA-binding response OmpR family regulator